MNSQGSTKNLTFFTKLRRKLVKFFLSQGRCNGSCDNCSVCPWIDKEKYSFEIRKKT